MKFEKKDIKKKIKGYILQSFGWNFYKAGE